MTHPRKTLVAAVLSALFLAGGLGLAASPASASDTPSDSKKSLKKFGDKMKDFGKKVGTAGKEAGEEISDFAKKVFYKGKKVSEPLLRKTQKATKDFWEEVIRGKEKAAEDLREENAKLKRELEDDE